MFRSSRRLPWSSRLSYTSAYSSTYQRKKSVPQIWLILAIPIAMVALELLLRLIVGMGGKTAEFSAFKTQRPTAPTSRSAYQLQYLEPNGQPIKGAASPQTGRLQVKRSPIVGYRLAGNQQSPFWQINAQGLRSEQPVPLSKPPTETRIVMVGGSATFGQLSAHNQKTIAAQLEARLNQQVAKQKATPSQFRPDVLPYYADELDKVLALPPRIRENRYRVVNAAVPGYVSSNEFAQLAFDILAYKPDLIVLMDGYADLMLPSQEEGADVPTIRGEAQSNNQPWIIGVGSHIQHFSDAFFDQFFLVKGIKRWLLPSSGMLGGNSAASHDRTDVIAQRVALDTAELNRRSQRYRQNLTQIAYLTSAAKVPLLLALQPEITTRNPDKLSVQEKEVMHQLGKPYIQQIKVGYAQLHQSIEQIKQEVPQGISSVDLVKAYENFPGEIFQDAIHLTDSGNTVVANHLFAEMAQQLQLQPRPYAGNTPPR